jgi:hypothetical protein
VKTSLFRGCFVTTEAEISINKMLKELYGLIIITPGILDQPQEVSATSHRRFSLF